MNLYRWLLTVLAYACSDSSLSLYVEILWRFSAWGAVGHIATKQFSGSAVRPRWQRQHLTCNVPQETHGYTGQTQLQPEPVEHNEELYWQRPQQDSHASQFIFINFFY